MNMREHLCVGKEGADLFVLFKNNTHRNSQDRDFYPHCTSAKTEDLRNYCLLKVVQIEYNGTKINPSSNKVRISFSSV